MQKLVPFELDPILRNFNPLIPCADCGKEIEFRRARIVMTAISDKKEGQSKEISLDELSRNLVWTILCQECWQRQYPIDPETDLIQ